MKENPSKIQVRTAVLPAEDHLESSLNHDNILPEDEIERLNKFGHPQSRRRFLFSRIMMRLILSEFLAIPPKEILITFGTHGKPLVANSNAPSCHFNLAHSGELIAFALSPEVPVGLDIEKHRENCMIEAIMRRFFSDAERREWFSLPERQRTEAFLRGWTRKEAFLKYSGEGISGLNHVEVSFADDPSRPYRAKPEYGKFGEAFNFWETRLEENYHLALVYGGHKRSIEFTRYEWNMFHCA